MLKSLSCHCKICSLGPLGLIAELTVQAHDADEDNSVVFHGCQGRRPRKFEPSPFETGRARLASDDHQDQFQQHELPKQPAVLCMLCVITSTPYSQPP
jgi:hypothetical protein